jgi:plastocyanin
MTSKLTLIAAVAVLALSVVAGSAVAGSVAHTAGSKTISVRDDYFGPKSITVSKGTTLRFVWGGRRPHNVVGPGANIGARVRGSASVKARSGSYVCTIHSRMKLSVRVR